MAWIPAENPEMKLFDRRRLINTMLIASLLLNASMLIYLAQSGGLRRFFLRLDLVELEQERLAFQKEMETRYRKYPNTTAEIVFAGDSLVADGPWAEFYSEIHSRGIGGDTTSSFLRRIDEVTESKPRKVFLLLGANDLSAAVPCAQFIRHYRAILERIRGECPGTEINVIGVLPVNRTFRVNPAFDNAQAVEANRQLEALVAEFPGVRFVDLTRYLVDESGSLRREFTNDGLHLNTEGFLAIREPLKAFVTDGGHRGTTKEAARP
jgi:lysophospholipase L1-like esterase